jgi:hypothetical protein
LDNGLPKGKKKLAENRGRIEISERVKYELLPVKLMKITTLHHLVLQKSKSMKNFKIVNLLREKTKLVCLFFVIDPSVSRAIETGWA